MCSMDHFHRVSRAKRKVEVLQIGLPERSWQWMEIEASQNWSLQRDFRWGWARMIRLS